MRFLKYLPLRVGGGQRNKIKILLRLWTTRIYIGCFL